MLCTGTGIRDVLCFFSAFFFPWISCATFDWIFAYVRPVLDVLDDDATAAAAGFDSFVVSDTGCSLGASLDLLLCFDFDFFAEFSLDAAEGLGILDLLYIRGNIRLAAMPLGVRDSLFSCFEGISTSAALV